MTVSPIWATRPPSTVGSTMTLTLDVLAGGLARGRRRGACCWSSVSATAERTSATSLSRSAALSCDELVDDRRQVARRGRCRPPSTRAPTVVGDGLAAEQVLDDLLAAARRDVRVGERGAQLVVALEDPGEAEQLVLDLVERALGRGDREAAPRRRRAMRLVGHHCGSRPG